MFRQCTTSMQSSKHTPNRHCHAVCLHPPAQHTHRWVERPEGGVVPAGDVSHQNASKGTGIQPASPAGDAEASSTAVEALQASPSRPGDSSSGGGRWGCMAGVHAPQRRVSQLGQVVKDLAGSPAVGELHHGAAVQCRQGGRVAGQQGACVQRDACMEGPSQRHSCRAGQEIYLSYFSIKI